MSNNIKKQSLLGKTPQRKKPTAPTNKRKAPAQANVTQAQTQTASSELTETKKSRTGIIVAGNSLYLCQNNKQPDTCQKYRVTEQAGFFSALQKLILD